VIQMFAQWPGFLGFLRHPLQWFSGKGHVIFVSAEFRTYLFLVMWSLLTWILLMFAQRAQGGVWFSFVTIVYLLTLQVLVGIGDPFAVVKAFGAMLILLTLGSWWKIRSLVPGKQSAIWRWPVMSIVIS